MIAIWMLYCLGIGLAFSIVGYAFERGLHFAGRPTRWAWVIALVGSYAIPVAAWLRPEAFATFPVPVPPAVESSVSSETLAISTISTIQPASRPFSVRDLDRPLAWGWGLASIALVLLLGVATTRLLSMQRGWRRATVDGRQVFVSPNVGPAVVGVWSPRVVLPEWALRLSAQERELMVAHEEEHMRATDPALIAMGFALVLLAPWNLALWWQWRRLRLAVEIDCDARVLAEGRSAPAYGELLLRVGQRRSTAMVGVAAFGEPASFLESRIRRMVTSVPRWRWVGVAASLIVAGGAIVAACEAPRPLGPQRESTVPPESSPTVITGSSLTLINGVVIAVIAPRDLDEPPRVVSGPMMSLPELPRLAGIEGPVVVQARINADGRVQPGSVTVLQSVHPALAASAKNAVSRSLFRPARAHGQAVAALVHVVYDFGKTASTAQRARELSDPATQDTTRQGPPRRKVSDALEQAQRHADFMRGLARQYEPGVLAHPPINAAIAMIVDAEYRVTAHTSGTREASDGSCLDVLKRLLPAFRNARFDTAGCLDVDAGRRVALYWGHIANH